MKSFKPLLPLFKKYRSELISGVFITVFARIFAVYIPHSIGSIITITQEYTTDPNPKNIEDFQQEILHRIGIILGCVIISGILTFWMRQCFIVVSRKMEYDLKNQIYQHYQGMSQKYYKRQRIGDLMNRISEDVSKIRMMLGPAIMYSINTITLFVVILTYMINSSVKLTLYTIIPFPILSFLVYKLSTTTQIRSKQVQESLSDLTTVTQESFSAIQLIRNYVLEPQQIQQFNKTSENTKQHSLSLAKLQASFHPSIILLIGLSSLSVIYIGGNMYINKEIQTIGTLMSFIIYVNMLTWPVATVGWITSIVQQAKASQIRVNNFLSEGFIKETNNKKHSNNIFVKENQIEIKFQDIGLHYEDTQIQGLKDITFKAKTGDFIAIMGKTGSGKTSLLNLITKLYQPSQGNIFIQNKNYDVIDTKSIRRQIAYVPQDTFLFSESIIDNLKFGNPKADLKEIQKACEMAQVHQTIMKFKDGYNTILGERGITLSGGQRQRIAIARALLSKAPILLLDDCLSAVDTQTEQRILKHLNEISNSKLIFCVTHRVHTAKLANHIIVLEKGMIQNQGTHNELATNNEFYQNLILNENAIDKPHKKENKKSK